MRDRKKLSSRENTWRGAAEGRQWGCPAASDGGMAGLQFPALLAPTLIPTQQVCGARRSRDPGAHTQAVAFCIWKAKPEPR